MGVETEIKFRMPNHNRGAPARLTVPGCKIGKRSESDLLSTYFDTRKHKLKRRGLLLRVRQTDGKHIQTIKKASGAQFKAYVDTVPVTVTSGQITIKFTPQVENPQINAIEIVPR